MIRWCNLQKRQMLKSSIFCLVVAAVPGSTPSAYEVKKLSRVTLSPFSPFTMSRTTRIPWYFARVPLDGLPVIQSLINCNVFGRIIHLRCCIAFNADKAAEEDRS
ncbi:hypothetical protein TSPI_01625 [Trichinella spiralis]|uniref:Secreted protein n=1 Tax=Trichinella spiralis TaxID=6334 RepID=A0ABR3KX02_TRISP